MKEGKKVNHHYFFAYIKNNARKNCRLGITISKKVGNAATRNRLKRHAREFFRKNRQIIERHIDINLIAKKEAGKISKTGAYGALESIFTKIAKLPEK